MSLDVKAALLSYRKKNALSESDKAHIDRWLAAANDVVWQKIVNEINAFGNPPAFQGGTIQLVIGSSLRARQRAETAEFESKQIQKYKQLRSDARRQKLLHAASNIEAVIALLHDRELFLFPPSPSGESKFEKQRRETCAWLEDRALQLKRQAQLSASRGLTDIGGLEEFVTEVVSRQRDKRGRRTREMGLFMKIMVNFMYRWVGEPRYEFVAKLVNVAFRNANLGAEEVRQNCRRARTGTLAP
jgi:hypothetical protein